MEIKSVRIHDLHGLHQELIVGHLWSRVRIGGLEVEGCGLDMCMAGGGCGNWIGSGPISMSGIL